MSLLSTPPIDALTPEELWATNAETPSTLGQYTGESFMDTLKTSIFGVGTQVGPDYQPPMSGGIFGQPAVQQPSGTKPLTEDEWKASKHYVPDIPYDPTMTEAKADFLKQQDDARRWRDSVYQRYQGGIGGQALGIAAMLAGGALAPENYIPILGPAARAYMATRLGRVGAHVAAGAAEGAIGNVATAPWVYSRMAAQGEDVGIEDVALDLAFGAILGGAFGGGMGVLADRGARARAMREAAISGRANAMNTAADALNLAADAVERGDAPDVARIVQPEMERARGVVERMPVEAAPARAADAKPMSAREAAEIVKAEFARALGKAEVIRDEALKFREAAKGRGGSPRVDDVLAADDAMQARLRADEAMAAARRAAYEVGDEAGRIEAELRAQELVEGAPTARTGDEPATAAEAEGRLFAEQPEPTLRMAYEAQKQAPAAPAPRPTDAPARPASDSTTASPDPSSQMRNALETTGRYETDDGLFEIKQDKSGDWSASLEKDGRTVGVSVEYSQDGAVRWALRKAKLVPSSTIFEMEDIPAYVEPAPASARTPDPRPIPPDPIPESVTTAAPRVGKSGDELQEFVEDLGLEDMSTIDMDLNELRRSGALTQADELALEAASAEAKVAADVATAYESLATCVVRYGT